MGGIFANDLRAARFFPPQGIARAELNFFAQSA